MSTAPPLSLPPATTTIGRLTQSLVDDHKYRPVDLMCELMEGQNDWHTLVYLLDHLGILLGYLQFAVAREVHETVHPETLFRASNGLTRLVSHALGLSGKLLRIKIGAAFRGFALRHLDVDMRPLFGSSLEIDVTTDVGDIHIPQIKDSHRALLVKSCVFLLDQLDKFAVDSEFIPILSLVRECVRVKFGAELEIRGVGAFLFLRWLTPILTSMEFGATQTAVSTNVKNISKIVQKLANDTLFDAGHQLFDTNSAIMSMAAHRDRVLRRYARPSLSVPKYMIPGGAHRELDARFLSGIRTDVVQCLLERGVNRALVARLTEVFLDIEVSYGDASEPLELPIMHSGGGHSDLNSGNTLSISKAAQEKLSALAENAPRDALKALVIDQAEMILNLQRKLAWLQKALKESRAANVYIRDNTELSTSDRQMIEKALTIQDQPEATRSSSSRGLARSISEASLQTFKGIPWDRKTLDTQMLRIASSLKNCMDMKHTTLMLLKCVRCTKVMPSRKAMIEHRRKKKCINQASVKERICAVCQRKITADEDSFQLHVNGCKPPPLVKKRCCPQCSRNITADEESFQLHVTMCVPESETSCSPPKSPSEPEGSPEATRARGVNALWKKLTLRSGGKEKAPSKQRRLSDATPEPLNLQQERHLASAGSLDELM